MTNLDQRPNFFQVSKQAEILLDHDHLKRKQLQFEILKQNAILIKSDNTHQKNTEILVNRSRQRFEMRRSEEQAKAL